MPEPEYREDQEYVQSVRYHATFDNSRYEVKSINPDKIPAIFDQRGLSDETVRTFAPFIRLIRDKKNENFDGYNIGFPYTNGHSDEIKGYELRGYGGYKSKAAGSDSSSSAWVADLSGGNWLVVKNVFFCESAFDAMAFYQMNQSLLKNDSALVSLGGTFSDGQVKGVMKQFPNARAFDCFDNDLAGRIYGLRMMSLLEDIPMRINKVEDVIRIEAKGKTFDLVQGRSFLEQLSEQLNIRYKMGQWLPPKAFKDWNDCLLNQPMDRKLTLSQEDKINNLAERRNAGPKL